MWSTRCWLPLLFGCSPKSWSQSWKEISQGKHDEVSMTLQRKLRRYQLSLRTILVCMLTIPVLFNLTVYRITTQQGKRYAGDPVISQCGFCVTFRDGQRLALICLPLHGTQLRPCLGWIARRDNSQTWFDLSGFRFLELMLGGRFPDPPHADFFEWIEDLLFVVAACFLANWLYGKMYKERPSAVSSD